MIGAPDTYRDFMMYLQAGLPLFKDAATILTSIVIPYPSTPRLPSIIRAAIVARPNRATRAFDSNRFTYTQAIRPTSIRAKPINFITRGSRYLYSTSFARYDYAITLCEAATFFGAKLRSCAICISSHASLKRLLARFAKSGSLCAAVRKIACSLTERAGPFMVARLAFVGTGAPITL
jgi:hypothetical protein